MTATQPPMGGSPVPKHRPSARHAGAQHDRDVAWPAPPAAASPAVLPAAETPGRGLAWAVAGASVVVMLTYVVNAVVAVTTQDALLDAAREGDVGRAEAIAAVLGLVGILTVVAWLVALVLTGVWLLKLRGFAERVNPHFQHGRRRWWAFGGWVVPVVSLWFPLQYLGNLRDALRPHTNSGSLFGWWWAAFLTTLFASRILPPDGETLQSLESMGTSAVVLAGLVLVALVPWLLVVRRLATAVTEVPEDVVRRTAFVADPAPYDPSAVPPGTPIYGPPQG